MTSYPNPSYIWRSILAGRKVLFNRIVWKPGVTSTTCAIWNAIPSGTYSVQLGYTCLEADLRILVSTPAEKFTIYNLLFVLFLFFLYPDPHLASVVCVLYLFSVSRYELCVWGNLCACVCI